VLAVRDLAAGFGVATEELHRGVHASHDLHIHRLVAAGDRLHTTGVVSGVEPRSPGAFVMVRLDTSDAQGRPVATTWHGSLYLGVDVLGPARSIEEAPALPTTPVDGSGAPATGHTTTRHVDAGAAHVYTECARIWNPIHTDPEAAQRAGLPGLILHGTATHALAVSEVVERWAAGDPSRVRRITGRFGAMVEMPSTVRITTWDEGNGVIGLAVANEAGRPAVRDGFVVLG
jgi:acyl dehydratase